jgi:hypothetical protein
MITRSSPSVRSHESLDGDAGGGTRALYENAGHSAAGLERLDQPASCEPNDRPLECAGTEDEGRRNFTSWRSGRSLLRDRCVIRASQSVRISGPVPSSGIAKMRLICPIWLGSPPIGTVAGLGPKDPNCSLFG